MAEKKVRKRRSNFRAFWRLLFTLPKTFRSRFTHKGIIAAKANRDVYYSTIFALASAALAFSSQFIGKEYMHTWLLSTSVVFFGITLLLVILIHFLSIMHAVTWKYFEINLGEDKSAEAIKDLPKKTSQALDDAFALMVISAYLDLLLLLSLLCGLASYAAFVVINL